MSHLTQMYVGDAMALPSYMSRRDGRYYMQVRLPQPMVSLSGLRLYRASLRTSDYLQARIRLAECLGWLHRMNDSVDYVDLFQKNVRQLRLYLADPIRISEDRLVARRNFEELLKNLTRRAKAQGCDPDMIEPEFRPLFELFVRQNVKAEALSRRVEGILQYERGRADMQMAISLGAVQASHIPVVPLSPETPVFPAYAADPLPISQNEALKPKPHDFDAGDRHLSERADGPNIVVAPSRTSLSDAMVDTRRSPSFQANDDEQLEDHRVGVEDESAPLKASLRFSEALAAYEEADIRKGGNADGRSIVKLIVQFIIDKMGDPLLAEFDEEAIKTLDEMLPHIPDRRNIPREHTGSLAARYDYAQKHGWDNLKRLTEARLKNGYHNALSRFFGWLIEQELYRRPLPKFSATSDENLVSIERDAFSTEEVTKIFSLPLFTGCMSPERIWVKGDCLVQNHLYWAYVISFLTGVRAGELGQIELDDIEAEGGIYYLQLRGFDPKKGRVARKDVKRFKTQSSHRTIPLHPLLLDLGLLDRIDDLRSIGCPVLFPEWEPYPKPGGEMRWGQPLTKSFQYLRGKIGFERFDVTLYSSRHWFAELIDNSKIKDAARRKLMGHTGNNEIPSRYGRKQRLTNHDLTEFTKILSPEINLIAELLMPSKERADRGELRVLKPWLNSANWSVYYREKLGRK